MPKLFITIDNNKFLVEIANTPESREKGLMFRKELKSGYGMLFIYPSDTPISMWMKNTVIPLSVAFIKLDGIITNVLNMSVDKTDKHPSYTSDGVVRFALEMPFGDFDKYGIAAGSKLVLTPALKTHIEKTT